MSSKKIFTDSIFLTLGEFLIRLKGIIFIPFIISAIGLDAYGIFIQIQVNILIVTAFSSLAMGMGFFRFTSKYDDVDKEKLSVDFWTVTKISLLTSMIGALVVYFSSDVISYYILNGMGLNSLKLSSLIILTSVLYEQASRFLQSRKKFKQYSIYNIFFQLIPYLGFLIGSYIDRSLFLGLLIYITIQILVVLILLINIIKDLKYVPLSGERAKLFINYSWPLSITWITGGLLSKIDRYFIGYFLGPGAIGIYSIIYAIASFLDIYTVPFRKYFEIYLPKLWDQGKRNEVIKRISGSLYYYTLVSVGSIVGLTFYLKPLVYFVLKKTIPNVDYFNWIVFICASGIFFLGITRFFDQIIKLKRINHFYLYAQAVSITINVILNWIFIPKYGLLAASASTLLSYFIMILILNMQFQLEFSIKGMLKFLGIIISTIPIILIGYYMIPQNIWGLLFSGIFAVLAYLMILFLFRLISINEVKQYVVR